MVTNKKHTYRQQDHKTFSNDLATDGYEQGYRYSETAVSVTGLLCTSGLDITYACRPFFCTCHGIPASGPLVREELQKEAR